MFQKMYLENNKEAQEIPSQRVYAEGVKSRKLDFQFYWRALTKHKWPIALFTALMTAGAIFATLLAKPIYEASATLLLESQRANITSIEGLVASEDESVDYYGTQLAILRSRGLAERVLLTLETEAKNGTLDLASHFESSDFNERLNAFKESIRVSPVVKTKLITIKYESANPEFAALVANSVANEYIQSGLDRRNEFKGVASAWMDERVAELKLEMEKSEDALLAFKKANGLVDLNGGVGRLTEQELLSTSSELAAVNIELSSARDLYRKVQSFKASSPQSLESLPFVQNDALVRSTQNELGQIQRDLNESRNRYGPKHPRIVDTESRLATIRATLNRHISRTVTTFENDYQLLNQRVASLKANLEQGKENIQVMGEKRLTMEALERDVAANRDQYNGLFDRIMETRTTDGLDEANAVVAEAAWVPSDPVKPNKLLIVGLTILGAFMFASAVAFLLSFLDDTVTSTEDIEKRLKTRLLGVLPLVNDKSLKGKGVLPLTPNDVSTASETYSEAVNTCRTALSVRNEREFGEDREFKVLLVTSSIPDEGKSTVALNLAHSFGQLERTLLIDCDLRKPSIAGALGIPAISVGLSSLLTQKPPVEHFIQRDVSDSFDCLTSGPLTEQPLEMLASDKFAKILELLKQRYDKIIIDSAPTHVVSDALVLSKLVDSVLYVVKPHKTPIKLIHSGLSRLEQAGASVAGVCVSQVDINKSHTYGGIEFHGFGINYQYGSHYRSDYQGAKLSKANLQTVSVHKPNRAA